MLEALFFDERYATNGGDDLNGTSDRIVELVTSHPELKAQFLKRCEGAERDRDFAYYRDALRNRLQPPAG